jgi:hypothetical protein
MGYLLEGPVCNNDFHSSQEFPAERIVVGAEGLH